MAFVSPRDSALVPRSFCPVPTVGGKSWNPLFKLLRVWRGLCFFRGSEGVLGTKSAAWGWGMVGKLSRRSLGWGLRCRRCPGCIWGSGDDEAKAPTLALLASRGLRGRDLAESPQVDAKALPGVPGGRGESGEPGKAGRSSGQSGGGQLAALKAHPRAPGYTLGSPTGASRLSSARGFLQPNDACSIRSVHSRGH